MKTVEFTKNHVYGGLPFGKGDKLELPDDRAAFLAEAKVIRLPKAKGED